jgi:hypothetical protein
VHQTNQTQKFGYILDLFRGSTSRVVIENRHHTLSGYGSGKKFSTEEAKKIMIKLLLEGFLEEESSYNRDYSSTTLKVIIFIHSPSCFGKSSLRKTHLFVWLVGSDNGEIDGYYDFSSPADLKT